MSKALLPTIVLLAATSLAEVVSPQISRGPAQQDDRIFCTKYRRMRPAASGAVVSWDPILMDRSRDQCKDACPLNNVDDATHSTTCGAIGAANYDWSYCPDPQYCDQADDTQYTRAPCVCDSDLINTLVDEFAKSLPAIGETACRVLVGAATGSIDIAVNLVIDQVEANLDQIALNIGVLTDINKDVIQAVLQFQSAYSTLEKGRNAFSKWIGHKVCASGALTDEQANQIYDGVSFTNDLAIAAATLPVGGAARELIEAFRLLKPGRWDRSLDPPEDFLPDRPHNDAPSISLDSKPGITPMPGETVRPTGGSGLTVSSISNSVTQQATPQETTLDPLSETSKSVATGVSDVSSTPVLTNPSASAPDTSQSSPHCTRRNTKRGEGNANDGEDNDCDDNKKTLWSVLKSVPFKTTIARTCTAKSHTQACAHYWSAINKAERKSVFECTKNHAAQGRNYLTTTKDWKDQHSDPQWHEFVQPYVFKADAPAAGVPKNDPQCNADEWPPAHFIPYNAGEKYKSEWGQQIRWIPGSENKGVVSLWNTFCNDFDGEETNGQRIIPKNGDKRVGKELPLNKEAHVNYDEAQWGYAGSNIGEDKTTTITSTYKEVTYKHAWFTMAFDWDKVGAPSEENEFHLRANPCWPQLIAPDDPGYVLLTSDKWYQTAKAGILASKTLAIADDDPKKEKKGGRYANPPGQKLYDDAIKQRDNAKRPSTEDSEDDQPPAQAPKLDEDAETSEKRDLILDEHGELVVRDHIRNITRPLTHEERGRVEIVPCLDRKCTQEAKDLENGHVTGAVVIPGSGPLSMPSTNIAVPTFVTSVRPRNVEVKEGSIVENLLPVETSL